MWTCIKRSIVISSILILLFICIFQTNQSIDECLTWNGIHFLPINGGSFFMGVDEDKAEFTDESPRHEVNINDFCMMERKFTRKDVIKLIQLAPNVVFDESVDTVGQAQAQLNKLGYNAGYPDGVLGKKTKRALEKFQQDNEIYKTGELDQATMDKLHHKRSFQSFSKRENIFDKEDVFTWIEAQQIAQVMSKILKRNVRLPNEAEWEYAARGGLVDKKYPWGNIEDSFNGLPVAGIILKMKDECYAGPWPDEHVRDIELIKDFYTGGYIDEPSNHLGLYDMIGNGWEWTSSLYMPYPYNSKDGREESSWKPRFRVVRGGESVGEVCDASVPLRGYGTISNEYFIRFVVDLQ